MRIYFNLNKCSGSELIISDPDQDPQIENYDNYCELNFDDFAHLLVHFEKIVLSLE